MGPNNGCTNPKTMTKLITTTTVTTCRNDTKCTSVETVYNVATIHTAIITFTEEIL